MKKTIIIPAGDPAGIGPEIIVKALQNPLVYEKCNPVVVGDLPVFERISGILDSFVRIKVVEDIDCSCEYATLNLLDAAVLSRNAAYAIKFGEVSAEAGMAAYRYITAAARLCGINPDNSVLVTPPINKQAIHMAGIACAGHTEILAEIAGIADPLTMFQTGQLRTFFLSRHVSLLQACAMVTRSRLIDYIVRCTGALRSLGLDGELAVAGLNPHNSDNGLFGSEEQVEIIPAIEEAQAKGCNCVGPVPADSVFAQAKEGRFAAVLSLYHDQGHIAAKTLDFYRTVSLTLGLPYLRTSVDHGTGFDIAGKGIANSVSMEEAILAAAANSYCYRG